MAILRGPSTSWLASSEDPDGKEVFRKQIKRSFAIATKEVTVAQFREFQSEWLQPEVGSPDRVAHELAAMSQAGIRGIAVSFVNFLEEVPYFIAEVLPRLVQLGIRTSHARGPNLASGPGPGRLGTRRSECCPAGADPDEV
jgi:hypothetical protein